MMTIHKEGYTILTITLLILLILNGLMFYFFPLSPFLHQIIQIGSLIFFLIILQFFRKPVRITIKNENHIIAPADGKVVVIQEVMENEFLKTKCRQISIFMSPINVHINFNPISGIVKYFKYHKGKYLVAWHPKASELNERTSIAVEHSSGKTILFRQIAGALANRIVWYVTENKRVEQGEEFGFIKFGSRIDIFIPLEATVLVEMNQKTTGGESVIATFV